VPERSRPRMPSCATWRSFTAGAPVDGVLDSLVNWSINWSMATGERDEP
jgi:hypothetical protein